MVLVKCIVEDNLYKHRSKPKIGELYYGDRAYYHPDSPWNIYDLKNNYIGRYHRYQFMEITEYREQQLKKLKI